MKTLNSIGCIGAFIFVLVNMLFSQTIDEVNAMKDKYNKNHEKNMQFYQHVGFDKLFSNYEKMLFERAPQQDFSMFGDGTILDAISRKKEYEKHVPRILQLYSRIERAYTKQQFRSFLYRYCYDFQNNKNHHHMIKKIVIMMQLELAKILQDNTIIEKYTKLRCLTSEKSSLTHFIIRITKDWFAADLKDAVTTNEFEKLSQYTKQLLWFTFKLANEKDKVVSGIAYGQIKLMFPYYTERKKMLVMLKNNTHSSGAVSGINRLLADYEEKDKIELNRKLINNESREIMYKKCKEWVHLNARNDLNSDDAKIRKNAIFSIMEIARKYPNLENELNLLLFERQKIEQSKSIQSILNVLIGKKEKQKDSKR